MYVNNKTPKHFPSFLVNNTKNDEENIKNFISPPHTVNSRKSEIQFNEFIKLNTAISNKKRISLCNIQDRMKDKNKNFFSSSNLNLKSPEALIMNLNNTAFPKANLSSHSLAEFSFPFINGDIRQSNARAKYILSREIQELIQVSNPKDKIKENKKFPFDVKNFNSIIDPIKNNIKDLKKLICGVEDDANQKILSEKKSLQSGVTKFLDKAEKNYNIQLEKKMKEILGLLNSIREINDDKFETYHLIKKKIEDYTLKNTNLVLNTGHLKIVNKSLAQEYNDKIYYRKNLIEFINEKKKIEKFSQEQNKNNSQIKLDCENEKEIYSLKNNLSKSYHPEKLDNVKFSLIKSFKELELKKKKLKKNLHHNSKKNENDIIDRIFDIIKKHKHENKEEFRFSTTIKSFHQDSKEKFYSAKTRYSLDKNIKFTKQPNDSSVNIKSLIELFVKDEAITSKFNQFNDQNKDFIPIE